MPTWTPYWLREYGLWPLNDPQNLLGGVNRVILAAQQGDAMLKESDITVIRALTISLDDVINMDVANKHGLTPKQAAHKWLVTDNNK